MGSLHLRLAWISHQKRVQQVQVAVKLVNSYMGWFAREISGDWLHLVGELHMKMQEPIPVLPPPSTGTAFVVEAGNVVNYLVRLDMNCPNTRNALAMDKYGSLLASMGRVFGETRFAVLVCLATRSREDSGVDVLEDEYNLTRKMQTAGFQSNVKIHQELLPPAAEVDTNYLQRDAFATYKVFMLQPDVRTAFSENKWCGSTALLQGKVSAAHTPCGSDLMMVTNDADALEYKERLRIIASTRAAQRGIECNERLLKDLFDGVMSLPTDMVEVIDLHSFNGDFGMALVKMRGSGALKCRVRHWLTEISPGKNGTQTQYAAKRHGLVFTIISIFDVMRASPFKSQYLMW